MNNQAIDPITLEVMRNAFYSIADEMIVALIRASYSTNIKDRRDASCAIYTSTGDVVVVAQSEIGTPYIWVLCSQLSGQLWKHILSTDLNQAMQ